MSDRVSFVEPSNASLAGTGAFVNKGVLDCSTNPNYPAGMNGDTYKVSVAGKIGGASGIKVEIGDTVTCTVDNSVSGNEASVGANWYILQTNIDPTTFASSGVNSDITSMTGLTGKVEFTETTAPATPSATKIDIFPTNDNGFSRFQVLDSTGNIRTLLRDTQFIVKNTSGVTITKGQPVYVSGGDVVTSRALVALAKADASSTAQALGLAIENITNGSFGRVLSIGVLGSFDTSALTQGQPVYVSDATAGLLTSTPPASNTSLVCRVGVCIKSDASTGVIEINTRTATPNFSASAYLGTASNLSDVANKATARANLGVDKFTGIGDTNYSILATDKVVGLNASLTAPRVWTLPLASTVNPGYQLTIQDEIGSLSSTNTLTIAAQGPDTIDGATTEVIGAPYGRRIITCDGISRWSVDGGVLRKSGNLSGLANTTTARANLGLNNFAMKTTDYTITNADVTVCASTSTAPITFTLPDAVANTGFAVNICVDGPYFLTLASLSTAQYIDTVGSQYLVVYSGETLTLRSNGIRWTVY